MAIESSIGSVKPYVMKPRGSSSRFEIDYSKVKNLRSGEFISSPKFAAGSCSWSLQYYHRGWMPNEQGSYVSVYLCLESDVERILVGFSFEVLDKHGKFISVHKPRANKFTKKKEVWGYAEFITRHEIKRLYRMHDVIVLGCNITYLGKQIIQTNLQPKHVQSYPGGLCEHIEKLWEKGERFDVTFGVEGESISAHRFILAARSPVFEAQLFGPMAEGKMEHIMIKEMKAEVFKALLHFIYTDQLAIDDHGTPSIELLQGLFVAADRYSLEKLTLLCEEQLEKNFSVETVVSTLLLADQHCRIELKHKCLEYVANPENFSQVVLTKGYLNIMLGYPSLLAELSEKIGCSSHFAKKQRVV